MRSSSQPNRATLVIMAGLSRAAKGFLIARKGNREKGVQIGRVSTPSPIAALAQGVLQGQRRALARALTLVESDLERHQAESLDLFRQLGDAPRAFRLGITGPPGAGKSTVIERLVECWLEDGHRVAVLAIDPSSRRTGGSLLGDKTRMGRIADHPRAFVRPSPNNQNLGGLGRRTPLMCALLERAGYSHLVVETVGVGQSEIVARYLVDCLLLVALPGAGDEVQGIKRGLMEEVDVIAVNKSDLGTSRAAIASLRSALRVFQREVPVLGLSALTGEGLPELLEQIQRVPPSGHSSEAYFFEQHSLERLQRMLRDDHAWCCLRQRVESGELDFLRALPELERLLTRLRAPLLKGLGVD